MVDYLTRGWLRGKGIALLIFERMYVSFSYGMTYTYTYTNPYVRHICISIDFPTLYRLYFAITLTNRTLASRELATFPSSGSFPFR